MEHGLVLKCPVLMVLAGQLWNVFKKLITIYLDFWRFEHSSLDFRLI